MSKVDFLNIFLECFKHFTYVIFEQENLRIKFFFYVPAFKIITSVCACVWSCHVSILDTHIVIYDWLNAAAYVAVNNRETFL